MELLYCTKNDFDQIIANFLDFWSSDRTFCLHHPIIINEFENTAFVFKEGNIVCAYLFGFYSQAQPVAYVHLIAVRKNYRRLGLGRKLYEHFIKCAKEKPCLKLKAITRPSNLDSIAFHKKIGMKLIGNGIIDDIPVVYDYAGPGEHRVVFMMDI